MSVKKALMINYQLSRQLTSCITNTSTPLNF